jgi:hypothetical protein
MGGNPCIGRISHWRDSRRGPTARCASA